MPTQDEVCNELGTYKSACCGLEIVIAQGARFPKCACPLPDKGEWKRLLEPTIYRQEQKPPN